MKISLDHLPAAKRKELDFVVQTLREGFAQALSRRTMPRYRNGKILKIILFGSYARGDWVEDPKGRYFSDYDILVVVNHDDLADLEEFWSEPDQTFLREYASGERLRTQPNFIVHSLDDVNEQLRLGRYFFTDILRDGITLFEEPDFPFVAPETLSAKDAYAETKAYFDEWHASAAGFLDTARYVRRQGRPKEAAFQLHQAAERSYHGLILALTLYSAKTHRLNLLRDRAEAMDSRLIGVWPRTSKFERQGFDLIRRAYVEARYSPHYEISDEHLAWLEAQVSALQNVVQTVAAERVETLRKAVA
ncbi:nucleotidyltransferase [Caulobacter sp. D4A]|uniref:HEPN domain-containing protein n=1 Tax=unclassified Caulobacter TaxID=2648921 RepID=UPI000D73E613|nr:MULTISPECIES: HEPN domain-containing protein [unclassified Caulobacter]PXA87716.1 nucleotidyltransferase [Caulobacter sp. D5]PXA95589.1 nucleotidyltransferase [Caulobacter sp. D4A]